MISSAFDLGEEITLRKLEYIVHPELWKRFNCNTIDINFSNWQTIKYLNNDCTAFSNEIDTIPSDKGGLYLFYAKCPIILGITEYPFYIGRAQLTNGQNLKKRVKEYFQHYNKQNERPKITKMFKYWGKNLHLAYLILEDNEDIQDLEKEIINSLLLPMNDQIPDKIIREGVKAF